MCVIKSKVRLPQKKMFLQRNRQWNYLSTERPSCSLHVLRGLCMYQWGKKHKNNEICFTNCKSSEFFHHRRCIISYILNFLHLETYPKIISSSVLISSKHVSAIFRLHLRSNNQKVFPSLIWIINWRALKKRSGKLIKEYP